MDSSLFLPNRYDIHWYTIESILGRGGFGTTYLARDNNLDRPVAIKEYLPLQFCHRNADRTVAPKMGEDGKLYRWGLDRFLSEAKTLAKFDHPNIVHVNSFFELNNTAYMVMKFEQGCDLAEYLARKSHMRDQQSLLNMVLPILEGLKLVHGAGFIHRDIKPANIYIRADSSPVLLDFGSARQSIPGQSSNMTRLISKSYTPFEQYNDTEGKQGPWTDIYSLSATLYYCITGELPVDSMARAMAIADNRPDSYVKLEGSYRPGYADSFLACIDWALSFREKDRPQSCEQWADALLQSAVTDTAFVDDERTVLERPVVVTEPLVKPVSERLVSAKYETNYQHSLPVDPKASVSVRLSKPKKGGSASLVVVLSIVLISVLALSMLGYRYLQNTTPTITVSPSAIERPARTDTQAPNTNSGGPVTEIVAKTTDPSSNEALALQKQVDKDKQVSAEIIAAKNRAEVAAVVKSQERITTINRLKPAAEILNTQQPIIVTSKVEKPVVDTVKVVKAVTVSATPVVVEESLPAPVTKNTAPAFDPIRLASLRAQQQGKASREIIGNKLRNFVKAMNKMDVRYLRSNSVFDPRTKQKIDGLASLYHASDVTVHDVSVSSDGQLAAANLTIKTLLTSSGTKMVPGSAIGEYALEIRKIEGVWYDISW